MQTEKFTEAARPLARINPASYSTEQNTARIDAALYNRFAIMLGVGDIATGRVVDMDIEQHLAASGGTPLTILGKTITQLTDLDDNKIVCVEVRSEELDTDGGYRWISAEVTPTTGVILWCVLLGLEPRYKPIGVTEWDEVIG